uniref:Endonuclease/exonuclease/phosphatase domain-containing protein n=1 Tax=Glossina austeni TaxID=7395 RepID=A0A1A9UID3_GLOAU
MRFSEHTMPFKVLKTTNPKAERPISHHSKVTIMVSKKFWLASQNQLSAGEAILNHNSLKFKELSPIKTDVIENIGLDNENYMLMSVYFRCESYSNELKRKFERDLRKIMKQNGNLTICGDRNVNRPRWCCARVLTGSYLPTEKVIDVSVLTPLMAKKVILTLYPQQRM